MLNTHLLSDWFKHKFLLYNISPTILHNSRKTKEQHLLVLNTRLNSSICLHLLILTARPQNLLMICSFKAYLCVNEKQTKKQPSQPKYLSKSYLRKYIKLPVLLLTFLIFKDSFSESQLRK